MPAGPASRASRSSCTTWPRILVATKTTSASGSYAFRFTAPGPYPVQVVPPPGHAAQPPVTLDVKMFDEAGVDFSLENQ